MRLTPPLPRARNSIHTLSDRRRGRGVPRSSCFGCVVGRGELSFYLVHGCGAFFNEDHEAVFWGEGEDFFGEREETGVFGIADGSVCYFGGVRDGTEDYVGAGDFSGGGGFVDADAAAEKEVY